METRSLKELCCITAAEHYDRLKSYYKLLPQALQCDIFMMISELENLSALVYELKDARNIKMLLRHKRTMTHCAFKPLDIQVQGLILQSITKSTIELLDFELDQAESSMTTVEDSIKIANFLVESGWFKLAEEIYTKSLRVIQRKSDEQSILKALTCCSKLLKAQNGYCLFSDAGALIECVSDMIKELKPDTWQAFNKAPLYLQIAVLLSAQSNYHEAFRHSIMALMEVVKDPHCPAELVVDTLGLCTKACVSKKQFGLAKTLGTQALIRARMYFGANHPKYAEALVDYGAYLLHADYVRQSVTLYEDALAIRQELFGEKNLLVGVTHGDLAYALYVAEYNTGMFNDAFDNSTTAKDILKVLPPDHLLLSSAYRVRALILEEMAIDSSDDSTRSSLLDKALNLHLQSLSLAIKAFGEDNVQTAKHFGNLGRIYQSLQNFQKAEEMHLKAIKIKEANLGEEDYEVALSIGHLASLYNYDMDMFDKAEELYLRSISISLKLFGPGFSGLEYDYRGLMSVYRNTNQPEQEEAYHMKLHEWIVLKLATQAHEDSPLKFLYTDQRENLVNLLPLVELCVMSFPNVEFKKSAFDSLAVSGSWSNCVKNKSQPS